MKLKLLIIDLKTYKTNTIIIQGEDRYDIYEKIREYLENKNIYFQLYIKKRLFWKRSYTINDLKIIKEGEKSETN